MDLLNAYYFRHHMYTIVPRHVREDMKWMADVGTDAVSLAILEQDLHAARANVDIICNEADRVGMKVWAVPSRWAGLFAGSPKVPSIFAANHPDTWMRNAEGNHYTSDVAGPPCSVHHPATREFFDATLERMLSQWPIAGVIWDEPKILKKADRSDEARKVIPDDAAPEAHLDAFCSFMDGVCARAKSAHAGVEFAMFLYANMTGTTLERCAAIPALDHFGCDGRPWRKEDGGVTEGPGKVLLDRAVEFADKAHANRKKSLALIENHAVATADYELVDRRMPEVMALGIDHLLYYYYPRNLEDPDRLMGILAKHLKAARG